MSPMSLFCNICLNLLNLYNVVLFRPKAGPHITKKKRIYVGQPLSYTKLSIISRTSLKYKLILLKFLYIVM